MGLTRDVEEAEAQHGIVPLLPVEPLCITPSADIIHEY